MTPPSRSNGAEASDLESVIEQRLKKVTDGGGWGEELRGEG